MRLFGWLPNIFWWLVEPILYHLQRVGAEVCGVGQLASHLTPPCMTSRTTVTSMVEWARQNNNGTSGQP